MKQIFTLFAAALLFCNSLKAQVQLNELYTDPGAGKHEFFELYNSEASTVNVNSYTLICFFDISGTLGWYVMDLPNLTVAPKGYFVGSSALPFNYQGITNSTNSDFSWNSATLSTIEGSVKKWVPGTANLADGNPYYDQQTLPANFNDFLFRRSAQGASYSVFLYENGLLVNSFIGGVGGTSTIINDIINMPQLYIDMLGTSTDFSITFNEFDTLPVESTTANAGSDNGYIRVADGACASWVKSSAQVNHTPKVTNGTLGGTNGTISVSAAIARGTAATGSVVNYDVVGGPEYAFPVEMQIYLDIGSVSGSLDAGDTFVALNTEDTITQGPFYTTFFPYNANILIVVKTAAGCLDKIVFIPNAFVLSVNLISFEGEQHKNDITLNWTMDKNEIVNRFEVEKSTNGIDFVTAGIVIASEKEGLDNYNFKDRISEKSIYRLKIIGKTGRSAYSKNLSFDADISIDNSFTIINNPKQVQITARFESGSNLPAEIRIIDMSGRVMVQQKVNITKGSNLIVIPLSSAFNNGLYIVNLFDGTKHYTKKFIKQ